MICYQDEKIVELPDCTMEELDERIRILEIKNFGHEIDFEELERKGEKAKTDEKL